MDTSYRLESNQHFRGIFERVTVTLRYVLPQAGIEPATLACHTAYKYHALDQLSYWGCFWEQEEVDFSLKVKV
jgi:hypothetical protein